MELDDVAALEGLVVELVGEGSVPLRDLLSEVLEQTSGVEESEVTATVWDLVSDGRLWYGPDTLVSRRPAPLPPRRFRSSSLSYGLFY